MKRFDDCLIMNFGAYPLVVSESLLDFARALRMVIPHPLINSYGTLSHGKKLSCLQGKPIYRYQHDKPMCFFFCCKLQDLLSMYRDLFIHPVLSIAYPLTWSTHLSFQLFHTGRFMFSCSGCEFVHSRGGTY